MTTNLTTFAAYPMGEHLNATKTSPLGQGGNTTAPYDQPRNIAILVSVWLILTLVSLIGNGIVFTVVLKVRKMRTATNYLLVNLSIADVLATLCTPLAILDFAKADNSYGVIGCKFQIYTFDVFYAASTFTLICVAIERYYAVCRPMKFRWFKKNLQFIIFIIWLCACIVYSPMLWACTLRDKQVGGERQLSCNCNSKWPKWYHYTIYAMCIVTCLYILPIFVMFRCYIPIISKLWKPSKLSSESRERIGQRKMVVKTLVIVMLVYCVLWTPYNVLYVLKKFRVDFRSVYGIVWYGALVLAFLSNCVNPILYTLMNRNFRESIRQICWRKHKSTLRGQSQTAEDMGGSKGFGTKSGLAAAGKSKDRSLTASTDLSTSKGDASRAESETKI